MKEAVADFAIRPIANSVVTLLGTANAVAAETYSPLSLEVSSEAQATTVCKGGDELAGAYSIAEFCKAHGDITRQHFHSLVKRGLGPRTFKVGRRTLVSRRAAADWMRVLESITETHLKKAA